MAFGCGVRSLLLPRDRDRQLWAARRLFSDSGLLLDLLCSMLISLERASFLELDLLFDRRRPLSLSTDGSRFALPRSADRCRSLLSNERWRFSDIAGLSRSCSLDGRRSGDRLLLLAVDGLFLASLDGILLSLELFLLSLDKLLLRSFDGLLLLSLD